MKNKTLKSSLLAGIVGVTAQSAFATVIYQDGFESLTAGTTSSTSSPSPSLLAGQDSWYAVAGAPPPTGTGAPNFDVITYAGNAATYTPKAGPTANMTTAVNVAQNLNGGLKFVADGDQSGDKRVLNFALITTGLVEMSVDYYPGLWFDNNGGNLNGAVTLRSTSDVADNNRGGFWTGRATSQPSGDANGNGNWAPLWTVFSSAGVQQNTAGVQAGLRFGVTGFDELNKEKWYRLGYVWDRVTGRVTQLKSQEIAVGAPTHFINDPQGPTGDLYVAGGINTPIEIGGVRVFNVGTGTFSAYDNLYAGTPYTWATPVPEPSSLLLLGTGLVGVAFRRRRA